MYVELAVLNENKVYLNNMLFGNVFDESSCNFDSHMVPSCAIMVLEIH
jgi:hypothetical protein